MFTKGKPTDPGAIPDAGPIPATNATPAMREGAVRWYSLKNGGRAKQFTAKLKSNAGWMKRFLHGGK